MQRLLKPYPLWFVRLAFERLRILPRTYRRAAYCHSFFNSPRGKDICVPPTQGLQAAFCTPLAASGQSPRPGTHRWEARRGRPAGHRCRTRVSLPRTRYGRVALICLAAAAVQHVGGISAADGALYATTLASRHRVARLKEECL